MKLIQQNICNLERIQLWYWLPNDHILLLVTWCCIRHYLLVHKTNENFKCVLGYSELLRENVCIIWVWHFKTSQWNEYSNVRTHYEFDWEILHSVCMTWKLKAHFKWENGWCATLYCSYRIKWNFIKHKYVSSIFNDISLKSIAHYYLLKDYNRLEMDGNLYGTK